MFPVSRAIADARADENKAMPTLRCPPVPVPRRFAPALVISALTLTACAQPTPEPRLVPTRTIAPRPAVTLPTTTPAPTATPQLDVPTSLRYTPVFTLKAPPLRQLGVISDDTVALLSEGHFETRDAEALRLQRRIPLRLQPEATAGVFWYAFSLDARRGAIMQADGSVDVYDLREGRLVRTFRLPEAPRPDGRSDLAFSADGDALIFSLNGSLLRLDTTDGQVVSLDRALPADTRGLRFSDDGTRVAAARANGDLVILSTSLQPRPPITLSGVLTTTGALELSFSPRGSRLAAADSRSVVIWELREDRAELRFRDETSGPVEQPARVSLTDEGSYALLVVDNIAALYDLQAERGVAVFQLSTGSNIGAALLSPDSQRAFLLGPGEIISFRAPDGDLVARQPVAPISRPLISPDNRIWAAWSDIFPSTQIALGDLSDPEAYRAVNFRAPVRRVAFSPRGDFLAVSTLVGDVFVVRADDGRVASRFLSSGGDGYFGLCFAPNNTHVVYTDGEEVFVHDMARDEPVRRFRAPSPFSVRGNCTNQQGYLGAIADRQAALLNLRGEVIWRAQTDVESRAVQAWDLSHDASTLAITAGGRVTFYNIARNERIRQLPLPDPDPIQTGLDGAGAHFVVSSGDRVDIIRVSDGQTRTLNLPANSATQFSLSRNAPLALTLSVLSEPRGATDRTLTGSQVSLWDLRSGAQLYTYQTRDIIITSASLSDNLETLVLGSLQNTLIVLRRAP